MTLEALIKWAERFLTRRPPRVIAGSFFSLSTVIILVGYFRGDEPRNVFLTLLAASVVSLVALGLRWIEKRCSEATSNRQAGEREKQKA